MPKLTKNNCKITISVVIVLFVNFLFSIKYLPRYTDFGAGLAFIILSFQLGTFYLFKKHNTRLFEYLSSKTFSKLLFCLMCIMIIALMAICHFKIPTQSLNVDRYSVIENFLAALFNGEYPYLSKSNMGNYPGPMPFYFLVAFPFNAIGELNILSGIGYILLLYLVFKSGSSYKNYLMLVLASSFFMVWEIAVRSNVLVFSVLILIMMIHYLSISHKNKIASGFSSAAFAGLLLSTRSVFILTYIICYLSTWKMKQIEFKALVAYGLIAIAFFGLSFLPFVIAFPEEFFQMNPFIVQSSFLIPKLYILLFMGLSVLFAIFITKEIDIFFYSGVVLFISIAIYFLYHIVNRGFEAAFYGSIVDISYFIFCIPFLIYYVLIANKSNYLKQNSSTIGKN